MAWQIPLSVSGPGVAVTLGSTDSLFVAEDVTLASTTAYSVFLSGGTYQQVKVHGTIAGAGGILGSGLNSARVTVAEGAHVASMTSSAINITGTGTEIRNAGLIEELSSASAAIKLAGTVEGSYASISNTGSILGVDVAIEVGPGMASMQVTNSGVLFGDDNAFLDKGASKDTILNTGKIQGNISFGGGNDLLDSRAGLVTVVDGGAGNDRLLAGAGQSWLSGAAGNDTLMGGAGADSLQGGADADTASYASATAGVTVNLSKWADNTGDAQGDTFFFIERLLGSKFADKLIGDGEANQLTGGAGADTLTGAAGADRFVFNAKPAGTSSADRITDFATDLDEIRLDDDAFMGLTMGNLPGEAFRASSSGQAAEGDDRILYETDTGWLRFDADGTGAGTAVAFAKLAAGLNLGADDFVVF